MNDFKINKYAPGYELDALSDILQLLKLDVSIYHNAKVCGDWIIDGYVLGRTCFHIVTQGQCLLDVPGNFSGVLNEGDLVIFPRELPHSTMPCCEQTGKQQHLSFSEACDSRGTGLLCGEVRFQHQGNRYLLDALPEVLIIRFEETQLWLKALLQMIVSENYAFGPASKVIFDRLAELLFTYAIRQYLADNPKQVSLLGLYNHERLARAVNAIHRQPEINWSLEQLAQKALMSRTSFAEVFKSVSGWTAGQYLTWWRMQLAWDLLKKGKAVASVAGEVGYQSEAAFSRAFKKMFDTPPGRLRREAT